MQTLNYLPPILKEIREIKVLMEENDVKNFELNVAIDNLYKDQYIHTTENVIKRYEDMLGITAKGTDTLEDRRFRILSIYNKQLPYTKTILEQNLTIFCGKDGYKLVIDYNKHVIVIKIALAAKSMFNAVSSYLEELIPMNLVIDLSLLYNQYQLFNRNTYGNLVRYTYKQMREDVLN